ncbi:MAG: ParB/RepB/Spo0J family partition protein [Rivularia sp. (in: cyanobacteria)]
MDNSFPSSNNMTNRNLTSNFSEVDPRNLKPHPRNDLIYGREEDVSELVELIKYSHYIKPLIVTKEGIIVSGHQRWKASLQLGLTAVTVEVREFDDELDELHTLLLENANREKNREQKVREGKAWLEVESDAARKRMSNAGKKSAPGRPAKKEEKGVENFPHLCLSSTSGKTRDRLARKVGLGSGRTYSKALKVVEFIDEQTDSGNPEIAEEIRQSLNLKSVDAAYKAFQYTKKHSQSTEDNQNIEESFNTEHLSSQHPIRKSCWNCQHKTDSADNHHIRCNKYGLLSTIEKSGRERGQDCPQWRDRYSLPEQLKNPCFAIQLLLPVEWQERLEESAAFIDMDAATWIVNLVGRNLARNCDDFDYDHLNFQGATLREKTVQVT